MTLRYNGTAAAAVVVTDGMGIVFSGSVAAGELFSFTGTLPNEKFSGVLIIINVNSLLNAVLSSNCNPSPVYVGAVYGLFTVMAGKSKNGGAICCAPGSADNEAPVFSNQPMDINRDLPLGACNLTVEWVAPIATDNCGVESVTSNHLPGELFPIGTTEVMYTARDLSGNESTTSFTIEITNSNPPQVSECPSTITVTAETNNGATVTWSPPQATSCGEIQSSTSHEPGSLFPIGRTTVIYTFTDPFGASTCSFDIVVEEIDHALIIQNALTPDGDGINDIWIIENIAEFVSNEVVLIDRWGSVVYAASGYDNDRVVWNGTNKKGDKVPTGTYFYTITVANTSSVKKIKGFVEVIQ